MLKLDFPDNYKADLLRILRLYLKNHEVWAYGSRVKGTNHNASDLDLVIRNSSDLLSTFDALDELRRAFAQSNIPIIIDVMDWASIPEHFREEIEKQHVVLVKV